MKKRILSILCAVAMLATMIPAAGSFAGQVLGTLIPVQDFEGFETGAGMPASKGNDFLRNNATSGAVYIAKEGNNQYLYAANAAGTGADIVYYSSKYALSAQSSMEMKISLRTTDALNSVGFYLRGGSISSYNFLTIDSSSVKVKKGGSTIPVSGYSWTPNAWHDITFRWNYVTGYSDIVIECGDKVYKGSLQDGGFSIGTHTATGIEIYATNILNVDNISLDNTTAPFVERTFIDDNFDDLTTTGWTDHANGVLSAVEYEGRKCLKADCNDTAGYYEPKFDCTDFTSDMGAAYLQTDFKLADAKGGFDIRFRDGGQIKVFNVSGAGKTEIPNCGNTFIGVGEDADWYTLKFLYSFTTKFAYVNISNEDGVCFTSRGTLASGPSSMQKLELVLYSGAEVYFDNIIVKNIEEDEIPVPGVSKYYSFNDLEDGEVIKAADKEDGSSAYYGWYHTGDGEVSAEEKDGRKAIVLETNDSSDVLVCEKLAVAADTIETDFMIENQNGVVSLQVAGSQKSYANAVSVADGKFVTGDEEICDFVPGTWYRAIVKQNSESASVIIVNLETGNTSSAQWALPSNVNAFAYTSFSVPVATKLYVDNFLAATEAKNMSATVNSGKRTVVAQDGLVIKADICNIDPTASSAMINGEAAIFDVTPWAGIKIKNLPKNETINVTYSIKDYNGNEVSGSATVETIDAYTFEDLDCYEENGDAFACVYGKVNVSGKTARLIVAVYSDDGMVLEKVSVLPILSSDSDECYTVRAGIDFDSSKHTIAAFLWGDDVFPIMTACK